MQGRAAQVQLAAMPVAQRAAVREAAAIIAPLVEANTAPLGVSFFVTSGMLREAAEVLKAYGAKEVYVFGSAASGEMDEYSDVDMAVSGLPPGVFFKAWARAARAFDRELDLIRLEHDTPFTRYLQEQGELRRVG